MGPIRGGAPKESALHTDGDRAYKLTAPGMVHDHVVHMKRRVKTPNGFRWVKPFFTKTFHHQLPNGEVLDCVGGTQFIDRFWRTLRAALVGRSCRVGSHGLERRIRACQWMYWNMGEDQWMKTGEMFTKLRAMEQ